MDGHHAEFAAHLRCTLRVKGFQITELLPILCGKRCVHQLVKLFGCHHTLSKCHLTQREFFDLRLICELRCQIVTD